MAVEEAAFGGMLVVTPSTCTAGWSVENEWGVTGVASAAHCSTKSTIIHPPTTTHALTFQWEHYGQWGDVEWYTTNETEPATFYSDNTTTRTTTAVEPSANISIGESVCLYSRVQGVRDCTLDVAAVSYDCTVGGVTHSELVQMNGDVSVGGDSGAGWSFNNTAYGIHKGDCGGGNVWTVGAHLPQIALAIRTN